MPFNKRRQSRPFDPIPTTPKLQVLAAVGRFGRYVKGVNEPVKRGSRGGLDGGILMTPDHPQRREAVRPPAPRSPCTQPISLVVKGFLARPRAEPVPLDDCRRGGNAASPAEQHQSLRGRLVTSVCVRSPRSSSRRPVDRSGSSACGRIRAAHAPHRRACMVSESPVSRAQAWNGSGQNGSAPGSPGPVPGG